jgi:hypothetical protein
VSAAQNGVRGVGSSCDGVGDWFSECCLSAAQDGSPIIASLPVAAVVGVVEKDKTP